MSATHGRYLLLIDIEGGGVSADSLAIAVVLPAATSGVPYAGAYIGSGGTPAYTYATSTGSLPPGLSLNTSTGEITGTPTTPGYYEFTASVTDSVPDTASKVVAITVGTGIVVGGLLSAGEVGIAYSSGLSASGGTAPYTWTVSSGSLPGSLSINATTGIISGTPSADGTFNFTLTATDAASVPQDFPTAITIVKAVDLSTSSFGNGVVNVAYSAGPTTLFGLAPFTYSISSGAIPLGTNFSPSNGFVTGTPTTAATYNFDVTVLDALGGTDTFSAAVVISASGGGGTGITSFASHDLSPLFTQTVTDPTGPAVDLAFAQIAQAINLVFAGPSSGSSANPTFRALVANDLPTVPITKGGTGQTTATAAFDALAPASPAKGDILVYNGAHWVKHTHGADGSLIQFDSTQSDGLANIVSAFVPYRTYNAVILSQSPTAYWRLNDASGAIVDSISGNNLTAGAGWVYQRSPLVPTDPSTLYAYIQQSVTCIAIRTGYSPFPAPNTGDWSISFCYKSDFILTTQRTVFAVARTTVSAPSTNNQGSFLFDASSERPTAFWNNGSGPTSVLVNSTLFDQTGIGRKLHYAMVVDGTAKTVTWYVDGCLASVVSYSVVPSGGTAVDTMIGNFSGSAFGVGGVLGEVAVWSGHKLTAAEVLAQALSGGLLA